MEVFSHRQSVRKALSIHLCSIHPSVQVQNSSQLVMSPMQEFYQIDVKKVKKQLRKVPNWKAPGPDQVHGYWLKNFSSLHERIAQHARMLSAWQCSDVIIIIIIIIIAECMLRRSTKADTTMAIAKVIHWDLCKKYAVKVQSKWYDHVPEKVEETWTTMSRFSGTSTSRQIML